MFPPVVFTRRRALVDGCVMVDVLSDYVTRNSVRSLGFRVLKGTHRCQTCGFSHGADLMTHYFNCTSDVGLCASGMTGISK